MESAIALVMVLLGLGLVGIPLLKERQSEEYLVAEEYEDSELDRLLAQKDTAVEAIRELEFDHAVGNLSDEDYADLKEKYERKAISVLKNLKEIGETGADGRDASEVGRRARATRAKREEQRGAHEFDCPDCGASHREGDRFCPSCGVEFDVYEDDGLTCPECDEPYEEGDVFCASCGAGLGMLEEELAADGEEVVEDLANEEIQKAVEAENPASDNKPKRRTRRVSSRKKSTGSNGDGA